MVRFLSTIVLFVIFANAKALDLDNFDRKSIVEHKIKELYISVSRYELGNQPKDWGGACPIFVYKFDRNGNIVENGLARLGSRYGFQYDKSNKLVSWSWEDKTTGELHVFKEDDFEAGVFKRELASTENRLSGLIASKKDYREPRKKSISDFCASIDAEYALILVKSKRGLPAIYKASKIRELGSFPNVKIKSPAEIYISYKYGFFGG